VLPEIAEMALSRKQLIDEEILTKRVTAFLDEKFTCIREIMKSVSGVVV